MWILTSKKTGSIYYLLPEKTKHTVGRTNTDLILKDDTSISRSHACIYVAKDHIKVVDVGSKYGTYYNENIENKIGMEKNKQIELKNGERVQFGLLGNEWTLSKLNICTLISALNADQRTEMKQNLDLIGGKMTETWMDSCTHLTMSEITVTLKALKALVENIPIVSCEYWRAYYKNLQDGKSPPKCGEYLPKLAETFLNKEIVSFGLNDKRKTIFQGKTFIFMDKKLFDKYYSIITCAGGECKNLNKGIQKSFLIKKDVIVIQHVSSSQSQGSQTINMIEEHIRSNGRRLIPDFEIGLAIIHCSTEKYCNAGHDITSALLPHTSTNAFRSSNILAEQTPLKTESNSLISEEAVNHDLISVELPESAVYNPEKSQIATDDEINRSHEFENLRNSEVGIEQAMEIENESKTDKIDVSQESLNFNKNTKRKRSSFEKDESRHTKKLNCSEDQSRLDNSSKKSQRESKLLTLDNFLDKSKIRKTNQEGENVVKHSESGSEQTNPRKRGKIAVIRDEDEDEDNDDDLFNFGGTAAKRSKQSSASRFNTNDHENEQDDGLFGVLKRRNNAQQSQSSSSSSSVVNNVKKRRITHEPNQSTLSKPSNGAIHNVVKSVNVNSDGWLSKSMSKIKIKSENEVKEENDETSPEWINSIRNGFEVRTIPMRLVSRSFQNNASVAGNNENNSSNTLNTTKRNFKAFVKKCNYKPQKEITPTVSFHVKCDFTA